MTKMNIHTAGKARVAAMLSLLGEASSGRRGYDKIEILTVK